MVSRNTTIITHPYYNAKNNTSVYTVLFTYINTYLWYDITINILLRRLIMTNIIYCTTYTNLMYIQSCRNVYKTISSLINGLLL